MMMPVSCSTKALSSFSGEMASSGITCAGAGGDSSGTARRKSASSSSFQAVSTMRAAMVDTLTKQLSLETVPMPEPGPDEVLVRVKASGICLSDVHVIEGLLPSTMRRITPGDEAAGVIERVGERVPQAWQPG